MNLKNYHTSKLQILMFNFQKKTLFNIAQKIRIPLKRDQKKYLMFKLAFNQKIYLMILLKKTLQLQPQNLKKKNKIKFDVQEYQNLKNNGV